MIRLNNLKTDDTSVLQYHRDDTYSRVPREGANPYDKQLNEAVEILHKHGYRVRPDGYIYNPNRDRRQTLEEQINDLLLNASLVNLLPKVGGRYYDYDDERTATSDYEYYEDKVKFIRDLIGLYKTQDKYEWGLGYDEQGNAVVYFDTPNGNQISFHTFEEDIINAAKQRRNVIDPVYDMYGFVDKDYVDEGELVPQRYGKKWVGELGEKRGNIELMMSELGFV